MRFASRNIEHKEEPPFFPEVVETLDNNDDLRSNFMKACLKKLGLIVDPGHNTVPTLSCLHLSSSTPGEVNRILNGLKEIITIENEEEYIKDENDTFLLENSSLSMSELSRTLSESDQAHSTRDSLADKEDRLQDYNAIIKRIVTYKDHPPASRSTPCFNHDLYFESLEDFQACTPRANMSFGRTLLYGETVTSTNTLLEKYTIIPALQYRGNTG